MDTATQSKVKPFSNLNKSLGGGVGGVLYILFGLRGEDMELLHLDLDRLLLDCLGLMFSFLCLLLDLSSDDDLSELLLESRLLLFLVLFCFDCRSAYGDRSRSELLLESFLLVFFPLFFFRSRGDLLGLELESFFFSFLFPRSYEDDLLQLLLESRSFFLFSPEDDLLDPLLPTFLVFLVFLFTLLPLSTDEDLSGLFSLFVVFDVCLGFVACLPCLVEFLFSVPFTLDFLSTDLLVPVLVTLDVVLPFVNCFFDLDLLESSCWLIFVDLLGDPFGSSVSLLLLVSVIF